MSLLASTKWATIGTIADLRRLDDENEGAILRLDDGKGHVRVRGRPNPCRGERLRARLLYNVPHFPVIDMPFSILEVKPSRLARQFSLP